MVNKKSLTFTQVKEFLSRKGFIIINKNKKKFQESNIKNLYLTFASSLLVILFFFTTPLLFEFKKKTFIASKEKKNNSKSNFEKILDGEKIETTSKADVKFDVKSLLEDIFKFDELPSNTVRLSASTLEQLFKDTNYSLKNVRKTKLVKPIVISLLPEEMKMIQNTKKRKNLFIQIILPLVLDENDRIELNRKKLFSILNKNHNSKSEKVWLNKKFKQYGVLNKDVSTLKIRMDKIPVSLAIAQAAKETGWGTSRFALEGNALFGQWTWSGEGIKPAGASVEDTHKVMKFKILQASVRAYQRNLNTHPSYKKFRLIRAALRDDNVELDSLILVNYLSKYAATGEEYIKILKKIIQQNDLKDFDDVKLLPTSLEKISQI